MERELKKAVEGGAADIDGCNTGGGKDNIFLFGGGCNMSKERRFTRPCFSCEEKRATGKLYDLKCILQFWILQIYWFNVFWSIDIVRYSVRKGEAEFTSLRALLSAL